MGALKERCPTRVEVVIPSGVENWGTSWRLADSGSFSTKSSVPFLATTGRSACF